MIISPWQNLHHLISAKLAIIIIIIINNNLLGFFLMLQSKVTLPFSYDQATQPGVLCVLYRLIPILCWSSCGLLFLNTSLYAFHIVSLLAHIYPRSLRVHQASYCLS